MSQIKNNQFRHIVVWFLIMLAMQSQTQDIPPNYQESTLLSLIQQNLCYSNLSPEETPETVFNPFIMLSTASTADFLNAKFPKIQCSFIKMIAVPIVHVSDSFRYGLVEKSPKLLLATGSLSFAWFQQLSSLSNKKIIIKNTEILPTSLVSHILLSGRSAFNLACLTNLHILTFHRMQQFELSESRFEKLNLLNFVSNKIENLWNLRNQSFIMIKFIYAPRNYDKIVGLISDQLKIRTLDKFDKAGLLIQNDEYIILTCLPQKNQVDLLYFIQLYYYSTKNMNTLKECKDIENNFFSRSLNKHVLNNNALAGTADRVNNSNNNYMCLLYNMDNVEGTEKCKNKKKGVGGNKIITNYCFCNIQICPTANTDINLLINAVFLNETNFTKNKINAIQSLVFKHYIYQLTTIGDLTLVYIFVELLQGQRHSINFCSFIHLKDCKFPKLFLAEFSSVKQKTANIIALNGTYDYHGLPENKFFSPDFNKLLWKLLNDSTLMINYLLHPKVSTLLNEFCINYQTIFIETTKRMKLFSEIFKNDFENVSWNDNRSIWVKYALRVFLQQQYTYQYYQINLSNHILHAVINAIMSTQANKTSYQIPFLFDYEFLSALTNLHRAKDWNGSSSNAQEKKKTQIERNEIHYDRNLNHAFVKLTRQEVDNNHAFVKLTRQEVDNNLATALKNFIRLSPSRKKLLKNPFSFLQSFISLNNYLTNFKSIFIYSEKHRDANFLLVVASTNDLNVLLCNKSENSRIKNLSTDGFVGDLQNLTSAIFTYTNNYQSVQNMSGQRQSKNEANNYTIASGQFLRIEIINLTISSSTNKRLIINIKNDSTKYKIKLFDKFWNYPVNFITRSICYSTQNNMKISFCFSPNSLFKIFLQCWNYILILQDKINNTISKHSACCQFSPLSNILQQKYIATIMMKIDTIFFNQYNIKFEHENWLHQSTHFTLKSVLEKKYFLIYIESLIEHIYQLSISIDEYQNSNDNVTNYFIAIDGSKNVKFKQGSQINQNSFQKSSIRTKQMFPAVSLIEKIMLFFFNLKILNFSLGSRYDSLQNNQTHLLNTSDNWVDYVDIIDRSWGFFLRIDLIYNLFFVTNIYFYNARQIAGALSLIYGKSYFICDNKKTSWKQNELLYQRFSTSLITYKMKFSITENDEIQSNNDICLLGNVFSEDSSPAETNFRILKLFTASQLEYKKHRSTKILNRKFYLSYCKNITWNACINIKMFMNRVNGITNNNFMSLAKKSPYLFYRLSNGNTNLDYIFLLSKGHNIIFLFESIFYSNENFKPTSCPMDLSNFSGKIERILLAKLNKEYPIIENYQPFAFVLIEKGVDFVQFVSRSTNDKINKHFKIISKISHAYGSQDLAIVCVIQKNQVFINHPKVLDNKHIFKNIARNIKIKAKQIVNNMIVLCKINPIKIKFFFMKNSQQMQYEYKLENTKFIDGPHSISAELQTNLIKICTFLILDVFFDATTSCEFISLSLFNKTLPARYDINFREK